MEKFVIRGQNKRSCTIDAPIKSPRKKIKQEKDEKVKEEEEEEDSASGEFSHPVPWQKIEAEGLDCEYALLSSKEEADHLFKRLEEEVVYSKGIKQPLNLSSSGCQKQQLTAMEKFVIRGQNKRSCTTDAPTKSPRKKIKQEKDEKVKEEEEEEDSASGEFSHPVPWQKIEAEGLDCDYALLFSKEEADHLFKRLEEEVVYLKGEEAQIQVFGKVYNIPRKQATYGDAGLTYTYSGVARLACPWTTTLEYIRDAVTKTTGQAFNFVLINRYKDGQDHMGEHRDDEKELDPQSPIASVSLGAARDFIFRHRDARGKQGHRQIEPVKLKLAHGSLLLMNPPTNTFWYHSLPVRKKVLLPRINLTFRRILLDSKK